MRRVTTKFRKTCLGKSPVIHPTSRHVGPPQTAENLLNETHKLKLENARLNDQITAFRVELENQKTELAEAHAITEKLKSELAENRKSVKS